MNINGLFFTLCWLFLSLSLSFSLQSLIETKYHYFFENRQLYLFTSPHNQEFTVTINLLSNYTWLYPQTDYNSSSEVTINNNNRVILHQSNKDFICTVKKDSFCLDMNPNLTIENVLFIQPTELSPAPLRKSHGSIGLSFYFKDPSYSFIHQLQQKKLIKHLTFSLVSRNRFFFGGIPYNNTVNMTHSYCNVIHPKGNWTCDLKGVIMSFKNKGIEAKSKRYLEHSSITFTTDNHKNYVPKRFFEFLINEVYNDKIESNQYKVLKFSGDRLLYFFNKGFDVFIDIIFVIEGYEYRLNMWEFWLCEESSCQLNMIENPYGEYWIVGNIFHSEHNIMFDYESKQIHFYSLKGVEARPTPIDYTKLALFFNSAVLITGLLLPLYHKLLHKLY